MITPISFRVNGAPKGQPRPKAFARKFGAKWMARVYDPGTSENWKSLIAATAKPYIPKEPMDGPVRLDLVFTFPRPKSHYRTGKHSSELREDAPLWHIGKPDRDNCDKAVLDCLTQLAFWRDDSQVCAGEILKFYGVNPGVGITIHRLSHRLSS